MFSLIITNNYLKVYAFLLLGPKKRPLENNWPAIIHRSGSTAGLKKKKKLKINCITFNFCFKYNLCRNLVNLIRENPIILRDIIENNN